MHQTKANCQNINNEHIFFAKCLRSYDDNKRNVETKHIKSTCTRFTTHTTKSSNRNTFSDHHRQRNEFNNGYSQHRSRSATGKSNKPEEQRRCTSSHGSSSTASTAESTFTNINRTRNNLSLRTIHRAGTPPISASSNSRSSVFSPNNKQRKFNNRVRLSQCNINNHVPLEEQSILSNQTTPRKFSIEESTVVFNDEDKILLQVRGENFYKLINEHYGSNVEKILRYHDIDAIDVVSKTKETDLFEMFDKPIDSSTTSHDVIELKQNMCSIIDGQLTLKIGIRNKLSLLLRTARTIIEKSEGFQSSGDSDFQQSYSSSSTIMHQYNNKSQMLIENYENLIHQSITNTLRKENHIIHGNQHTNISGKDFNLIFKRARNENKISCVFYCLCQKKFEFDVRHVNFYMANFREHIKMIDNQLCSLIEHSHTPDENRPVPVLQDQISIETVTEMSFDPMENSCESSNVSQIMSIHEDSDSYADSLENSHLDINDIQNTGELNGDQHQ